MNCFVMNSMNKIRLNKHDQEQLEKLIRLLHEKQTGDYTIHAISRLTGINRYKLTYGFKQLTGHSVHQFLIKTRMENAKKLLIDFDKPVKEIAHLCGYHNTQNFIKAFKKCYKQTPSQFRKTNNSK